MTHPAPRPSLTTRRQRRGFTLIELMITVAIIGIMARLALPAYFDYVKRGKLSEAFSNMTTCTMSLAQYYQDNRSFVGANTSAVTATCVATTPNFTYSLPTGNLSATAYLVQATGNGGLAGFTYTVDQTGLRATTAAPSGWTTNASCWVNSKSGCQ